MKALKKLTVLILALSLLLGTALILGSCDGDEGGNNDGGNAGGAGDGGSSSNGKTTYTVTVTDGATGVKGVKVIVKGNNSVKIITTAADGKASVELETATYEAQISQLPSQYSDFDKSQKFNFDSNGNLTISLSDGSDDGNTGYTYTVYLKDASGNPIAGAQVQICDTLCKAPKITDSEGKVVYTDVETENYKAQITTPIDGYAEPADGWDAKYAFDNFVVTITLAAE